MLAYAAAAVGCAHNLYAWDWNKSQIYGLGSPNPRRSSFEMAESQLNFWPAIAAVDGGGVGSAAAAAVWDCDDYGWDSSPLG